MAQLVFPSELVEGSSEILPFRILVEIDLDRMTGMGLERFIESGNEVFAVRNVVHEFLQVFTE